MDCKIDSNHITDFYFGTISENARSFAEEHMFDCQTCLKNFFSLKRDIELGKLSEIKPLLSTRLKIENEVREIFDNKNAILLSSWSKRPRTLIFGGIAAAAAIIFAIFFSNSLSNQNLSFDSNSSESSVENIAESIDSGAMSPGHINTL